MKSLLRLARTRQQRQRILTMLKIGLGVVIGILAMSIFSCGKLLPQALPEIEPTPVYFGEGDVALMEDGEAALQGLASKLRGANCPPVRIRGYSTPAGAAADNALLGWQRACWVVDSLAMSGVDPGCFAVESVGEREVPEIPVDHRRAVVVDLAE